MFSSRKYFDDYVVEVVDKNGKPKKVSTYIGEYYEYDSVKLAAHLKIFLCIAAAFLLALFVGAGCVTFSNNVYYVLLPFVCQPLTLLMLIYALVELMIYRSRVKAGDKKRTLDRVRPLALAHMIICAICVVGEICFILFDKRDKRIEIELIFVFCNALASGIAYYVSCAAKDIKMHSVINPEASRIERQRAEQKILDDELKAEEKEKQRVKSREVNEEYRKRKKR